ncbi:small nuclear ribonucleoprotein SmD3b-like [Hibiscus syriacus]|uniref:small nuclear ribonucleoprotein SmD3b-like n=1 Tax=Hibiscus syriacus TaxID=106335 RepID=UPI0019225BA4|nr:small nuclear ribonucleoprotein SmD3b-like [Hibiscus syriacus]XP_039027030.1 small nuclear ribonucleoprotein SmD3b-like [Hibiscus syriacus]
MSRSLGIPVKLLHEASGHIVTVELKSGELYRGSMVECEDNWNCQLENITFTAKDGKVSQLEHVFIRGSKVRFMVIPDMLKNAPMFKRLDAKIKGKSSSLGVGRGRAVAVRAKAQAAGRGSRSIHCCKLLGKFLFSVTKFVLFIFDVKKRNYI